MTDAQPPTDEVKNSAIEETAPAIDTSRMSAGQRAALELTEAARETPRGLGFASGLFMGRFDLASICPFPEQSAEDRDQGDAFDHPAPTPWHKRHASSQPGLHIKF